MTSPPPLFDPKLEPDCPLTLDDAVSRVLGGLSARDLAILTAAPDEELDELNRYGLGASIRKDFALWRGNRALMAACGALNPEDTSIEIIRAARTRARS
jgi:hypothetical protein